MNLDLWKIFYEVATRKNISKASEYLHISQPAITKQIKNLEEYLNCKLFIRSQKGVILTREGEEIFQDIKNGLNNFENAVKKINNDNSLLSGTIKIGISTSLAKSYLMPYIKLFHEQHPNITFEISTDPTNILKSEMKKGTIDLIIAKFPIKTNDGFKYIKLGKTEDVFIASDKYNNLKDKNIKLKDLIKYPILLQKNPSSSREHFENYCNINNIKLHTVMEIASSNLLIDFVKIGYGIGVVTKKYVQKEIENNELFILNVTPKIPSRNFGIIILNGNYLSKISMEFLKTLI